MAHWEDVLDQQLDLSQRLADRNSETYKQTAGFGDTLVDKASHYASGPGALNRDLPARLSAMTFNADPVYVDPDMMTVWEAAIDGFDPEPLRETDLIMPAGFLVLPRAVRQPDRHGNEITWRAVMWHPQRVDYDVTGDPDHAYYADGEEEVGKLDVVRGSHSVKVPVRRVSDTRFTAEGLMVTLWHDTRDTDHYDRELKAAGIHVSPGLYLLHLLPWAFGEDRSEDGHDPGTRADIIRPVQSLWRLMGQTLADRTERRGPKPFRRRWEKARWPEKAVTLVTLRRPRQERQKDEPETVNWTHRWIVGGHWRWQWYATPKEPNNTCGHLGPNGQRCQMMGGVHRQIWISPFVKGPEDKPLEVKRLHAYQLVQ